jgi:branched-chain amino acid transport system permease protein
VIQAAISGALEGGLFALMAIGLSLTWGMLKVINLAHFAMILLAAYLTFQLATTLRIDPLLTLVVTAPVMFALGAGLQWGFQRSRISEFNSLLVTFGLLIIVSQVISNIWTASIQRMTPAINPYATQSIAIGPLAFPLPTLLAFVFGLAIVAVAHLALERTFTGRALRAFAQDRQIAAAFGIDHERLAMLLAGAAGASAAVAGMLFAVDSALTPATAFEWIGVVFAVVIIGGIGNVVGTMVAGALVGLVAAVVAFTWSPVMAPFVVFSLIVIALLFRPRGLFARGTA